MNRNIPGTIEVEGREFFYIEILSDESFDEILNEALPDSADVKLPKAGGIIEEKVRIRLDKGVTMLGVSYKGDLVGWRNALLAYCKASHRRGGIASRHKLVLSDGTEIALGECEASFDR